MGKWALKTGKSITTLSVYDFDKNLKAVIADIYYPGFLNTYTAYTKECNAVKYWKTAGVTEVYSYMVNGSEKKVPLCRNGYLLECMSKKYLSANVTVATNQNSKLSKSAIESYLNTAQREGATESALQAISYALARVGWTYTYGGAHTDYFQNPNPKTYDCSAFVSYSWAAAGYAIAGGTHAGNTVSIINYMTNCAVSENDIRPGDICVCQSHAALYIGNGLCAEAASSRTGIVVREWARTKSYHAKEVWHFYRPEKGLTQNKKLATAVSKFK